VSTEYSGDEYPTLQNVTPIRRQEPGHQAAVTEWIISTMTPDKAAYALALTPGSRFHVPAEYLIGHESEFASLRVLIEQWDLQVFLSRQFAAIDESPDQELTPLQQEAWVETMERVEWLGNEIDRRIREEF